MSQTLSETIVKENKQINTGASPQTKNGKHRVVIIGGGFGGLYAARRLGKKDLEVTLIDKRNFHLFQPLLYQVATGGLSPGDIASPLRAVLNRYKNIRVIKGKVNRIDPDQKIVYADDEPFYYDSLIVAAGAKKTYFGNDGWQEFAPGLKSLEDALNMRQRIFERFEMAEREPDPQKRQALLTFVIIGGGPTGVELAGALAELAYSTLKQDFREMDPRSTKIMLIEGGPRILPAYPEKLSRRAIKSLRRLKVTVETSTFVREIHEQSVIVTKKENGEEKESCISSASVLWAAGIQSTGLAANLAEKTGAETDRAGRIKVQPDLTIDGYPDIFVIGDMALVEDADGEPLPGVAQVAMQQGKYAARLIRKRHKGRSLKPFRYQDRGNLAVIGRNAAVADLGRLKFSGWPAWLLWVFIHIAYLIEFDNRVLVMFQWATNYFTRKRGARLITGTVDSKLPYNEVF